MDFDYVELVELRDVAGNIFVSLFLIKDVCFSDYNLFFEVNFWTLLSVKF